MKDPTFTRWRCLTCPESGTTDASAERHTEQTTHATCAGTWAPDTPVCPCGHRALVHAYVPGGGLNVGRCLVRECGCAAFGRQEGAT